MKRILAQITLLVLSVLLSACLEMTSVITANKDGSAIVEETVLVSAQMKAMMAAAAAGGGGEQGGPNMKDLLPDQAKAEERAKKLGDGVTVKSREEVKTPDGKEGVKVTYSVPKIANLKYEPFNSDNKGGESKPITFKLDGSKLSVSLPPDANKDDKAAEKPKMPKEQMQAQLAMMKPMFAGMRVNFQIKGANGIASSDASNFKGDAVTVMDIQFDKLMENQDVFMKVMESMDDKSMTPKKVSEQFKNVDGLKIEGKEAISIDLK